MINIKNIPATEKEISNETAEELKKNIETLDRYLKEIKADHGEDRQAELLKAWHEKHLAEKSEGRSYKVRTLVMDNNYNWRENNYTYDTKEEQEEAFDRLTKGIHEELRRGIIKDYQVEAEA